MKKIIFLLEITVFIIFILLCAFFLTKKYNKKNNDGNNKNIKEIEQYILDINSYKAEADVTIISNKNENQYKIIQEVNQEYVMQMVKSPERLANMEMFYKDGNLEIKNTDLNLGKVYKNYPYITNNVLFLTDFIEKYKISDNKSIEEYNDSFYMTVLNHQNQYNQEEVLRINKDNLRPESIEIKDINNQTKAYILYNEIELNI